MSFPAPDKFNLVVAAVNEAGDVDFLDATATRLKCVGGVRPGTGRGSGPTIA